MAAATNSSVFHISNTRHTFYKRYPCYRGHSSFELPHLSFVSHRNVKLDFESKKLEWKRGRREELERKRTKLSVKCTAEGIDGGMIVGEDGINNVISNIPERYKVVCLVACVMCLCNADRVVMSVAVVPLAAKHGWSSSFLGIVQVLYIIIIIPKLLIMNIGNSTIYMKLTLQIKDVIVYCLTCVNVLHHHYTNMYRYI